ncbi:ureidoglycolate lyase [Rhizobium sp. S152]|uniref:ureidoglycolate lyase n=1 Tax=Rhizobium sp. S152 TaxID=3055038 RepID=UPI0025AA1871|nr:ureidoglycolate lyase [Rhizobium sp. S152]MDM9627901.1 ureidoglycolate lyase [Rhizobium sp. S152]
MIIAKEITEQAFAPFGQLVRRPDRAGQSIDLVKELANLRDHAGAKLSVVAVASTELPLDATQMERHIHSSQAFIPVDCDRYLIMVAPHGGDGQPDASQLHAFIVPGDLGINYKPDTWHHPITALGRTATFVVLTFIEGDKSKDEQFVSLPEIVKVGLAEA